MRATYLGGSQKGTTNQVWRYWIPGPRCEGDGAECRFIEIAGNTRFDLLLVRD